MARYANNSNYRNDSLIRKEMCVSSLVVDEIRRIVKSSEIMKEDDAKWPQKNKDGRQELEIRLGSDHISFEVCHRQLESPRSPRGRGTAMMPTVGLRLEQQLTLVQ